MADGIVLPNNPVDFPQHQRLEYRLTCDSISSTSASRAGSCHCNLSGIICLLYRLTLRSREENIYVLQSTSAPNADLIYKFLYIPENFLCLPKPLPSAYGFNPWNITGKMKAENISSCSKH